MGCFLGCFGGEKDRRRRRRRLSRGSPQRQRNRVENVHRHKTVVSEQQIKENVTISEQPIKETVTVSEQLANELQTKTEAVEQRSPSSSPSPKKKVTFNSNITTYEHVQVHDSIESLPECPENIEKEKEVRECSKTSSQSNSSVSSEANSEISSLFSYPPSHRYHNARDSDDGEDEEYGDSDLDDDDDDLDGEYDEDDGYDEDIYAKMPVHDIWSEPVLTESVESRRGKNPFSLAVDEEVESSPIVVPPGSKGNARDRSDYINSVLNPVENTAQWKVVKSSKGTTNLLRPLPPQKENLTADADNFEPPRVSLSSEPTFKNKTEQSRKNGNREVVAVDASLSNWLSSPEVTPPKKKTGDFGGFFETNISGKSLSEGHNSVRSFEDRPILGALTVEELRQISATNSPRKSPSRSPDEMPIIGSVGTYWNDSSSKKHSDSSSSFKGGIPNTTNKYREDKRVNWYSTPFEARLDSALLSQGAS
ncbi:Unknown protein [Striga hermonthica]|uniref:Uncharacterized protein n=1 Tax=Striga hermonthica TaxID=68872 RepID=A0A9N7NNU4_STRHE|nr:Unknown protein [Striga hermonthica]